MTVKQDNQYQVRFLPDNIVVRAGKGESLLKIALKAGVHLTTTCGGSGTCSSCRILIIKGNLDCKHSYGITEYDFKRGVRLACQSCVTGDVVVEVPKTTDLASTSINAFREIPAALPLLNPITRKLALQLPVPTIGDNRADLKRLKHVLKNHGYENVLVDYDVVKQIPGIMREKNWSITATLCTSTNVPLLSRLESGDTTTNHYGAVFDLGTTAVRGRIIAADSGQVMAEETAYNRQREYGEDIISRISYCRRPEGIEVLQKLISDTLNVLIEKMVLSSGIDDGDISSVVIAGNTVMVQLLLAIDPEPLRLSPYVPAIDNTPPVKASELGINLGRHCYVHIIPVIASYVGGDIVAGIAACGMHESDKVNLYIDIGTNGEIVLGKKEWMVTIACSAGPTFEGGGIRHGMLAVAGAIEDFELPDPCGEPSIRIIGDINPAGICGSGLINAVSALFTSGLLGRNGKFNSELSCSRLRKGTDGFEYVLADGSSTSSGKDIVLTEVDVDNFIRSKAAIYAGCQTLADSVGIGTHEIDNIIIAGTFGSQINIEKAVRVGLLPDMARDKFRFVGNGSLKGAHTAFLSLKTCQDMLKIADMITGIELSENEAFMDNYVSSLFLPHTDLNRFPSFLNQRG
ncbi:MAG: ASKHA domain-containing protein [Dehalococcoidales bacterium]